MLNLAFMKKYFGNTVPPHTVLFSGSAGSGDITLSANWQQFDMLIVMIGNDSSNNLSVTPIPVWHLKQAIALQKSASKEGVALENGSNYWYITKASTTTKFVIQTENAVMREIWGIKFE